MRKIKYVLLTMSVLLLFGCSKDSKEDEKFSEPITGENVHEIFESVLEDKYDLDFNLKDVQKDGGGYLFDKDPSYSTYVTISGDDKEFFARFFTQSGTVKDEFARLIYQDQVEGLLESILESQGLLDATEYNMCYELTSEKWTSSNDLFDYLRDSGSYVSLKVNYEGGAVEDISNEVFALVNELDDNGLYCDINIKVNGSNHIMFFHRDDPKVTKEQIKDRLSN